MGNLLGCQRGGGGDKNEITSRDRAMLDLKVQRDRLKQYQKKVIFKSNIALCGIL